MTSPVSTEVLARIAEARNNEGYDGTDEQLARSVDPEAARDLWSLMSDISEQCYCAGWLLGNEDTLWRMVTDRGDTRRYGQGEDGSENCTVHAVSVEALRYLHERCGGWWVWDDSAPDAQDWGPRFLTTKEWLT
jgi:hypothetical protein